MKEGPDIAAIAALIGDPARANMLTALMDGRALTASELAEAPASPCRRRARIWPSCEAGLLRRASRAGTAISACADADVGDAARKPDGLASAPRGFCARARAREMPALRKARICYDHLAGDYGVRMLEALIADNGRGRRAARLG